MTLAKTAKQRKEGGSAQAHELGMDSRKARQGRKEKKKVLTTDEAR